MIVENVNGMLAIGPVQNIESVSILAPAKLVDKRITLIEPIVFFDLKVQTNPLAQCTHAFTSLLRSLSREETAGNNECYESNEKPKHK